MAQVVGKRDATARPSRREQATEARPELEVVRRPRRRLARPAIVITMTVVAVVFGSLAMQVSLIHRQQRLDTINSQIDQLQLANKELRARESRLQSPGEILRLAKQLGMVESRPAALVTPPADTIAAFPSTATAQPSPTTTGPAGG